MNAVALAWNITQRLQDRKEDLEKVYSGLHTRAEAQALLAKLQQLLENNRLDGMADAHNRLFNLLAATSETYKKVHCNEKGEAVALLTMFIDKQDIAAALAEYEKHVNLLPSKEEVEQRFLKMLSEIYSDYKTSSDYMTRLVNRLLHDDLRTCADGSPRNEPTAVLILRQFIHEFGSFEKTSYGNSDTKTYRCRTLAHYINNVYGGDCRRMAREADADFLLSLAKKASPVHDWATLCAIIETKGAAIPAQNWQYKNLLRRVFIPEVLADEEAFEQAKTVAQMFCMPPSNRLHDCVRPDVAETNVIRDILNRSFAAHSLRNPAHFPAHVRLSVLCQYYKDFVIDADNPLLSALSAVCNATTPIRSGMQIGHIFDVQQVVRLTADKISPCAAEGLEALEAQVDNTEKYVEQLYSVIAKKCANRIDTLRESIVDLHYSDIARIAVNLADAFFDSQHKTREYLYLFAVAFGMTNGDIQDSVPDDRRDIRKNLFEDFYADNLLNHLEKPRDQHEESLIDGYGINYKNYIELIFLYCINQRKNNRTSLEILQQACRMIKCCAGRGKQAQSREIAAHVAESSNDILNEQVPGFTAYYKRNFMDNLLSLNEQEFCNVLIAEYECSSNTAAIAIRSENRTAYNICMQLFDYINALRVGSYSLGGTKETDHGYIADPIGAQNILAPMAHCRREHCRGCSVFRDVTVASFRPTVDCKSFGQQDCILNGLSVKDPQLCRDCPQYTDVGIHTFIPYYDCPSYASCNHVREIKEEYERTFEERENNKKTVRKGRSNDSHTKDYSVFESMLSAVADRERNRLADACCRADRFAWFAENKQLDENFRKLLSEIADRLNAFWDAGPLFDIDHTGRTTMIALYYLYLVVFNHTKENRTTCSFAEYYSSFCNDFILPVYFNDERKRDPDIPANINNCLRLAGYQPINPKNIYDIFVCFLAYKDSYDAVFDFSDLWTALSNTF